MLGILSGVLFAYAGDLPQISALDDYSPSTITRVYAANGQVVGEFATQRRVVVGYDDISRCSARRSSRPRTRSSIATSASTSGASSWRRVDRHPRARAARRAPAR